ncbi:MAG: hypothetical protein WDN23_16530 [Edaphobacter sp.]
MKMLGLVIVGVVFLAGARGGVSGGQVLSPPSAQGARIPGVQQPKTGVTDPEEPDPLAPHRDQQQAALRNADRQKRLVADTDKLLALATDLKQQVDKSTKDTLSVDVIKKADEIEKLAHSVKERMKG